MAITFTLNGKAVNDQTTGLQTGDFTDDAFTDTDVAYSSLPASFQTYLEQTLLLNSTFPTNVGVATKTNSVTVNATGGAVLGGTTFTDALGGALDGDDSGLDTVDGKDILLFADGTDTVIGKYDSDGVNGVDSIAFVIRKEDVFSAGSTIDQVTFHIVTYVPIKHPNTSVTTDPYDDAVDLGNTLRLAASETINFGFAGAPSGSNLFMTFGNPNSTQIVVIGKDPLNQSQGGNINTKDVLNISQAGGTTSFGVNGNQINPNEGAFITYVTGANTNFLVPNLSQNEADVEANIDFQNVVNASTASFTVNQTNPPTGPVTVKISAFSTAAESGVNFVDGLTGDTHVNITSGSFVNASGGPTPVITVNADGTLTVSGLATGDTVQWTTSGTHNRVLIENISNADGISGNDNNTFDIGGFGIAQAGSASTSVGQQIVIEDDGPAIDLTSNSPTIAVDESVGTGGSSKDEPGNAAPDDETAAGAPAGAIGFAVTAAATLFSETADAGTDGQASKVYSLVLSAGATGLTDTATGQAVVLSLVSGVVEGRTAGSNALVFTIAVDAANGDVTTALFRALNHGADLNDHDSAVSMASGLVALKATLTDGDTDLAADSIELGSLIGFEDDGPAIDLTSNSPTIAVDESVGTGGSSKDEPGNAAPDDETAAGAPAGAIGFAVTAAATLFSETADAGTDGQASKVYSLVLSAGATGLTDTATGQAVVLSLVSGVVEGRTAGSNALVFTIAVDAANGDVTTALFRALNHGADLNDHDSAVSMASGLVALKATLTDGDTDLAADSIELGSLIGFEDDGPAIDLTSNSPTIAVDESVGTGGSSKDEPGNAAPDDETAAGAPAGAIGFAVTAAATLFSETADAGTDGQASKVYSLVLSAGATGLTDTATGQAVVLSLVSGVVEGRTAGSNALVFTIAVDAANGDVTTALFRALNHGADLNDHDSAVSMASGLVALKATLTDGDTDLAADSIELGSLIGFEDDGPAIDLTSNSPTIAVDESVGTGGSSKDEPGNAAPDDETAAGAPAGAIGFAVTAAATLFSETADAGTDGQASKVYSLVLSAGATGLTDTATGQAVVLSLVSGVVEGRTAGSNALVFTIAVDAANGDVTTALFRALNHGADLNDHDSAVSMASGLVALKATLTDGDTDLAADSIELGSLIGFEDDGPAIDLTSNSPTIAVDKSVGTGGSSKDEPGNAAPDDETAAGAPAGAIGFAVTAAATLFSETADAGTDGQASKVYSLVLSAGATGLTDTATGQAVVLSLVSGVVEGRTAGSNALVFTIAVDAANGDVTTALFRALNHGADLNDHDSAVSMVSGLVALKATLTDGDTDLAADSIELGSLIGFEDDGPAIDLTSNSPTIAVDESVGTGGSSKDEPGNAAPDDETAAGAPAGAIGFAVTAAATLFSETADAGTDGQASKVYSLVLSAGATGLTDTATGQAVVLSLVSGVVEGRTAGSNALVFTIAVDAANGDVTTALFRALNHGADLNDHDSAVSMASGLVALKATLTDGDTDLAADSIELGSLIGFEDDGPAIDLTSNSPTIAVDESVGTGGSSKDEPGNAAPDDETAAGAPAGAIGFAVTAAATLFSETADAGTDGQASKVYSLVLSAGATGLTDTATGQAVVLSLVSGVVEGRTAGSNALVFTIAVDAANGDVTTALFRALNHGADLNDHDSAVSMVSGLVALKATLTDGDTDLAADSIELGSLIGFEDDGPAIGPIADGLVDFTTITGTNPDDFGGSSVSSVTKSLNGIVGSDDPAAYSVTSSPATLTIFDGTNAQMTLQRDISPDATVVTYYKDADNSGTHNTGDIDFFQLTLSGGNYTFDVLRDPPPAEIEFAFAGAPSGSNLFMMFGAPTSAQIVVIGEDPLNQSAGGNINTKDVLNISQAGSTTSFGVNGNQINPDEGAFITYVTGANTNFLVPNLSQNEADVEANIDFTSVFNATKASFTVNQTNPPTGPVTVKISAFTTAAETGVNFVDGLTGDTGVNILEAHVIRTVLGQVVTDPAGTSVSIDGNGDAVVSGLRSGDEVQWTTSGTHNRVLIENISNDDGIGGNNNNTLDIGGFSLLQAQPAPDEKLDFTVQIADADGDTASASFSIGIDGTGINDDDQVFGILGQP